MAVDVQKVALAHHIITDTAETLEAAIENRLTDLCKVADAEIERYAPQAPEPIKKEAAVRYVSYLYDIDGSQHPNYSTAFTNSGAKGVLSTWRKHTASVIDMPNLERTTRQRLRFSLDSILEHGSIPEGKRVPDKWGKVWCRRDPGAELSVKASDLANGTHRGEGYEAAFVVRFARRFKADDWVRHEGETLVIARIETLDRKRGQRLHCKRDSVTSFRE